MLFRSGAMMDMPNWKKNKIARNAAYNAANYSRVVMEIPKDKKARLQKLAAEQGLSLTGLIMACVEQVTGI